MSYRIIVKGRLSDRFAGAFRGMRLVPGVNRRPRAAQLTIEARQRALDRRRRPGGANKGAEIGVWLCTLVVELARRDGVELSPHLDEVPAVEPARFVTAGPAAGSWARPPVRPPASIIDEAPRVADNAIARIPWPAVRAVLTLRDVEGWPPDIVSDVLGIDHATQRQLLHRGRCQIQAEIEAASNPS